MSYNKVFEVNFLAKLRCLLHGECRNRQARWLIEHRRGRHQRNNPRSKAKLVCIFFSLFVRVAKCVVVALETCIPLTGESHAECVVLFIEQLKNMRGLDIFLGWNSLADLTRPSPCPLINFVMRRKVNIHRKDWSHPPMS